MMRSGLVAWGTHSRFAASSRETRRTMNLAEATSAGPQHSHSGNAGTMMIDRTGALKPGPAGHRRCRGGCGLDRAGPADPLFHHWNERQRVAVAFQINELREKAYSPRNRKERTQGSPRSLDQRRSSEKKLSQHLTETPSCEGPPLISCAAPHCHRCQCVLGTPSSLNQIVSEPRFRSPAS
jgi:hypothetical protein